MSIVTTPTVLPITRWAQVIGLHPLHFEGVVVQGVSVGGTCGVPLFQHAWQFAGRLGREEIAQAIAQAEQMVAGVLGYWPAPRWFADERHAFPRPARPELYRMNMRDPRGQLVGVRTRWHEVHSGGQRAVTLIGATQAIVYTDVGTDGYSETATVTIATSVTDTCEVRAFYPGHSGQPRWEIRPITVAIAGGVATITFRREQAVAETLLERLSVDVPDPDIHGGIEGTVAGNFLTTVDVYRVYNDPQSPAQIEWSGEGACTCGSGCTVGTQTACLMPMGDPRDGWVTVNPATWDAESSEFGAASYSVCRDPDHVRLWYFAGYEWREGSEDAHCQVTRMDPDLEQIVSRLAASMLDRDLCGCADVQARMNYYREDLALSNQAGSRTISMRTLDCPWGTARGAVWAWQRLRQSERIAGQAVLT